jgi:hypothetical protein
MTSAPALAGAPALSDGAAAEGAAADGAAAEAGAVVGLVEELHAVTISIAAIARPGSLS